MTPTRNDPPFTRIKIRVAALVFCGDDVALIRRDRPPHGAHYSTIGGNVEGPEPLPNALARELQEELGLDLGDATAPELLWVLDQRVSRPGPTPPPRKMHLIFRLHVTPVVRTKLRTEEHDELPGGSVDVGAIEWVDYRETDDLHIYPPVGHHLAALHTPRAAIADAALEAITDANFTWR
ncbi:NUDIX hydrolase [Streptomyces parvulus]|uniref:NUDIX hydrolase n=1 Tax=Streptomyces parvulus TaxID=146923 RepID=UPI0036865F70